MTADREIVELAERYMSPSMRLSFPPVVVDRAEGCWFWNRDGRRFLDLHSMACIMNVGYGHPRVHQAVTSQMKKVLHGNPAYVIMEETVRLAERLANIAPGNHDKKVCFGLSGSDANDAAMKLVRAATGRPLIVSYRGAYHGNTYGALSLSAVSRAMRRGFNPVVPGVVHITYPDSFRGAHEPLNVTDISGFYLSELEQAFESVAPPEDIAAVFIEPIQGDSGVLVPPDDYLPRLRELADRHGFLLVAEEVQTGLGRTGELFAVEHWGVVPDVLVLGKALGGGMPVAAVVAGSDLMEAWSAPGHVLSTSGSPASSAAALAVLDIIDDEGLVENSNARGLQLKSGLRKICEDLGVEGDIRGRGLMVGLDLVKGAGSRERNRALVAKATKACFDRGVFITFLAGSVMRFVPPLVLSEAELDFALDVVESALHDALSGRIPDSDVAGLVGW